MQGQGHLEGPNSVHVCSDDGDSFVASLGVSERETPQKIHLEKQQRHFKFWWWVNLKDTLLKQCVYSKLCTYLAPWLECAPLRTEENILEVQLDVVLNTRHFGESVHEGSDKEYSRRPTSRTWVSKKQTKKERKKDERWLLLLLTEEKHVHID